MYSRKDTFSVFSSGSSTYSIYAFQGAEIHNTVFDSVNSNCVIKSAAKSPFNNYLQFIETGACEAEGAKTFDKIKKTICIQMFFSILWLQFLNGQKRGVSTENNYDKNIIFKYYNVHWYVIVTCK